MERGLDKLINLKSKRIFQQKTSKKTFRPHLRPLFFCLGCPNLRPLVALPQKYLPRRFSETPLIWWTCWSFRRQIVSDELKHGVPLLVKKRTIIDSKCLWMGGYVSYVPRRVGTLGNGWTTSDMLKYELLQECPNVSSLCCDDGSLHIDPFDFRNGWWEIVGRQ